MALEVPAHSPHTEPSAPPSPHWREAHRYGRTARATSSAARCDHGTGAPVSAGTGRSPTRTTGAAETGVHLRRGRQFDEHRTVPGPGARSTSLLVPIGSGGQATAPRDGMGARPDPAAHGPTGAVPAVCRGRRPAADAATNSTPAMCSRERRSSNTTDAASRTGWGGEAVGPAGCSTRLGAGGEAVSAVPAARGAEGGVTPGADSARSSRSRPLRCRAKARRGAHRPRASWPDSASATPTSSTTRCSSRPWRPALRASHRRIHGRPPQSCTSKGPPLRTSPRSHRKYLHRAQGRYTAYGSQSGITASQATWVMRGSMTAAVRDRRRIRVLLPLPGNPETTTSARAGYVSTAGTSSAPRRSTTPRGRTAGPWPTLTGFPASVAPADAEMPTT